MKKHILYLDHAPERAVLVSQRMSEEDRAHTHWETTVAGAISVLKKYGDNFKAMYLDHDLEDARGDYRSPFSGMELVRWLEKRKKSEYHETKIICISWNLLAGRRMASRLRTAGYDAEHLPYGMNK
jgi:hypothetical protein